MGYLTIRGTCRNDPRDIAYAMVHTTTEGSNGLRTGLWPQSRVTVAAGSNDQWEAIVQFGAEQDVTVCIVRANELGQEMIKYYEDMKLERERVVDGVVRHYGASSAKTSTPKSPRPSGPSRRRRYARDCMLKRKQGSRLRADTGISSGLSW